MPVSGTLLQADTIPVGSEIWTDDEDGYQVWIQARVVRQENTSLTIRRKDTGEELEIDLGFGETFPTNPKVVSDMTSLHHIHEAAIMYNLGERAKLRNQRPYTFMGTILIAVNPLQRVSNPDMADYMDRPLNPETPHPYAIAELAYHQMRLGAGRKSANQSIVVSGESGAGKTETSKIILDFLTHRSVGGVANLDQKVVDSSPILESFGNAKTLRNNNSSRFGKFLKLQFTRDKYRLAGAFIETYLLEKSRVLTQGEGERNFHILYQVLAGASDMDVDLKLGDVETYRILSQSDCTTLDGVDDAAEFGTVKAAFDTIGMEGDSQIQVWQMLASVLHISNLEFDKVDHEQGEIATISDRETLSTLADFLAVEESALESMLTQRVVVTRGETFTKQLVLDDAILTRDAIVKSLYEALFLWVVGVINTSLGKGPDSLPFIGVLDIFGFENFDTKNEFEQLLINFTNESLQDTFNKQVFNNELKLYEEEGIDVVVSSRPDNSECLKMLTGRPKGIIPSLDNVCAEPNPTDARYLSALHKDHAQHEYFPRTQPRDMRENFWVKHYAGKVKYTVEGWVERNMDRIPESFNRTLASSSHKVVKDATTNYGKAPAGGAAKAKPTRARKALVKPTVAKAFLGSMTDLNATLLGTTCNFTRCIKPNAQMQCGVYDNRYVVDQLQCLGILQTCEVLKVGMPTRVTYAELKEVLGENAAEAETLFAGEPETALIAAILWAFEVPSEVFRLGRTRVFFRAGQISTLQRILNETGPEKAPWIFGRLQEALANRHKAKASAEEAQAAVTSIEPAVAEAEEETTKAIGAEEDDGEGPPARPPPKPVLGSDDRYKLESAAQKARKAGNCVPQVEQFLEAAREDEIGTYAVGAMERVVTASEDAIKTIKSSTTRANELEAAIRTAKGGDTAGEIRRLEDSLKRLRSLFQEAKELAVGSGEAAAKCQVEKTADLMEQTKRKSSAVAEQASSVTETAKGIADTAKRQVEALREANEMLPAVEAGVEEALAALSSFRTLVEEASDEENAARIKAEAEAAAERKRRQEEEAKAAAERKAKEEEEARAAAELEEAKKAAEEAAAAKLAAEEKAASEAREAEAKAEAEKAEKEAARAAQEAAEASVEEGEEEGTLSTLPSKAPGRGERGLLMKKQTSQSVRNLLGTLGTPDMTVSPRKDNRKSIDFSDVTATNSTGGVHGEQDQLAFEARFKEAMESGLVEGHLMKQSVESSAWRSRFCRLEENRLILYDTKSLVGTRNNKRMELMADSTTSYTNVPNCFCVRTGQQNWILLAKNEASMEKWMTAINARIHGMFIKLYNVPEDNYRSQGLKGQFFYRMVLDVQPQWIRTYPEDAAPRTGEGLFPGEIIEVVQVLSNRKKVFLRLANDRGWTYAANPEDGSVLFEEMDGVFEHDELNYRAARAQVPVLHGPSLESQMSGDAILPGELARATGRFIPSDVAGTVFVKLAGKRGCHLPEQRVFWLAFRFVSAG
eukprot:g10508.t1